MKMNEEEAKKKLEELSDKISKSVEEYNKIASDSGTLERAAYSYANIDYDDIAWYFRDAEGAPSEDDDDYEDKMNNFIDEAIKSGKFDPDEYMSNKDEFFGYSFNAPGPDGTHYWFPSLC